MLYEGKIWVGTGEKPMCLLPQRATDRTWEDSDND